MISNSNNNISQQKVRNSNLELYRIFVMLAIVAHHYVVNSGLMPLMDSDPLNHKSIFLYVVGMWGKTGINCFVLITGYYMCKSEITLHKFLKLFLEIIFYNIIIYLVFVSFGYIHFSVNKFIWLFIPVRDMSGDFVSAYLVFYLFIPFLTSMVCHLNQRYHLRLVMLCVSIYSIMYLIPGLTINNNYVTWFCVLFVIGSYLRIYPLYDDNTLYWFMMFVGSLALSVMSVFFFLFCVSRYGPYALVADSNAPLAVLVSICAFMLFKSLKIKQSKFINVIGAGTFGVLLIHANSGTMRQWLWKDLCDNVGHYTSNDIYMHAIIVPIIVFAVCSVIEYVRMKTIEKPLIDITYNIIQRFLLHG